MRLQAVTQQSRKTIIDQCIAARQTCCYIYHVLTSMEHSWFGAQSR